MVDSVPFIKHEVRTTRIRFSHTSFTIPATTRLDLRIVIHEPDIRARRQHRTVNNRIHSPHHIIEVAPHLQLEVLFRPLDIAPHGPGHVIARVVVGAEETRVARVVYDAVLRMHFGQGGGYKVGDVLVELGLLAILARAAAMEVSQASEADM
jgi:hypothetical protein